jgi:hypothetical protein
MLGDEKVYSERRWSKCAGHLFFFFLVFYNWNPPLPAGRLAKEMIVE